MARWRALIVDDHADIRRAFRAALEMLGKEFEVVDAPSAEEGMLEARLKAFDLLVVDMRLPGVDGLEMIARLRKANPRLRCVMISGLGDSDLRQRALQAGADAYFAKPIEMEVFLRRVQELLRPEGEPVQLPRPATGGLSADIENQMHKLLQTSGATALALLDASGRPRRLEGDWPMSGANLTLWAALAAAWQAGQQVAQVFGPGESSHWMTIGSPKRNLLLVPLAVDVSVLLLWDVSAGAPPSPMSAAPWSQLLDSLAASLLKEAPRLISADSEPATPLPVKTELQPVEPASKIEPEPEAEIEDELEPDPGLEALFGGSALPAVDSDAATDFWDQPGTEADLPEANPAKKGTLSYEEALRRGLIQDEQ